jgi:hypothetical protein
MKSNGKIHYDYLDIKTAKCGIGISKNTRLTGKVEKITCKNCLQSIIKWNNELINDCKRTIEQYKTENVKAHLRLQKLEGINCQK